MDSRIDQRRGHRRLRCSRNRRRCAIATGKMLFALATDIARILVSAKTLQRWMPNVTVACPLGKLDFGHLDRLNPVCVSAEPTRWWWIEGRAVDCDFFQIAAKLQTEGVTPARTGADFAGKAEVTALVVA